MIKLRIEEDSAAPSPDATQKQRLKFLRCLYDLTHGSAAIPIHIEEIMEVLHLEEQEAETTIRSLLKKDLIRLRLQCIVSLTQAGIDEVKASSKPTCPAPGTHLRRRGCRPNRGHRIAGRATPRFPQRGPCPSHAIRRPPSAAHPLRRRQQQGQRGARSAGAEEHLRSHRSGPCRVHQRACRLGRLR